MNGGAKIKNQHFVPQMYLSRFSYDKGQIFAFDKLTNRSFPTSYKNVASETYFYDIPTHLFVKDQGPEYDEQAVEKYLSEIESVAHTIFKTIISTYILTPVSQLSHMNAIREDHRAELAFFIALQFLRTRIMRNLILEFEEKTLEEFVKYHRPDLPMHKFRIIVKNDHRASKHADVMLDHELLGKIAMRLLSQIWVIGINQSTQPFYTSDNPVVVYDHRKQALKMGGLWSQGVQISFPLNSNLVLSIFEPSHFRELWEFDNRFALLPQEASPYNEWQILMAERFVFCEYDAFEQAKEVCSQVPKCKLKKSIHVDRSDLKKRLKSDFPKT
ncbi:MAG: DUF4238 domain-containing protein [Bacilli bacterium]